MKIKSTILFLVIVLSIFSCGKDSIDPEEIAANEESLFGSILALHSAKVSFYEHVATTSGDFHTALFMTKEDVDQIDGVEETAIIDSLYLQIGYKDGYHTTLWLDQKDENGKSYYRGGSAGGKGLSVYGSRLGGDAPCANEITNKKVLFWSPLYSEFGLEESQAKLVAKLQSFDEDLKIDIINDKECTPANFNTMDKYGLVFINSHGLPEGTVTKIDINLSPCPKNVTEFRKVMIEEIGQANYDLLRTRQTFFAEDIPVQASLPTWWTKGVELEACRGKLVLASAFIRNMPMLSSTILLNNSCNSGQMKVRSDITEPIGQAYLSRKPRSYYCYGGTQGIWAGNSGIVDDGFCKAMAEHIVNNLTKGDSTGLVHKLDGALQFHSIRGVFPRGFNDPNFDERGRRYFLHYEQENYCYKSCKNENDAFFTATITGLDTDDSFAPETFGVSFEENRSTIIIYAESEDIPGESYGQALTLATTEYKGVGTYSFGGPGSTNGDWVGSLDTDPFTVYLSFDAGQITITDDCETYIEGTFSLPLKHGGTEIQVTNGNFLIFY